MKDIKDCINESCINESCINEDEQINEEWVDFWPTIYLMAFVVGSFIGASSGAIARHFVDKYEHPKHLKNGKNIKVTNPVNWVKFLWEKHQTDKEFDEIAKKLQGDKEIMEFIMANKRNGWRKLLQTKLDEKEMDYLYSLTRNSVKYAK